MLYSAAFDASEISGGTLTLATAGKTDIVLTLSSITGLNSAGAAKSVFFHYSFQLYPLGIWIRSQDPTATLRRDDICVTSWETMLTTRAQEGAVTNSWTSPTSLLFSMSLTTGLVTVSYTTTFSLTWSSATGRALCGFSANQSGASSYVGTVVPTYVIAPTLPAVCLNTPNFEPDAIATHVVADDGSGFGTERYVSPVYRDWVQQFEVKAKTMRASAASTHPWTFQHLMEHCRGRWPFLVISGFGSDSTDNEVFSLRTEGTRWNPDRGSFMDDAQFHVQFKTVVEGTAATS